MMLSTTINMHIDIFNKIGQVFSLYEFIKTIKSTKRKNNAKEKELPGRLANGGIIIDERIETAHDLARPVPGLRGKLIYT